MPCIRWPASRDWGQPRHASRLKRQLRSFCTTSSLTPTLGTPNLGSCNRFGDTRGLAVSSGSLYRAARRDHLPLDIDFQTEEATVNSVVLLTTKRSGVSAIHLSPITWIMCLPKSRFGTRM